MRCMKTILIFSMLSVLLLSACTSLDVEQCEGQGGYIKGDIGDGSVMRERCGDEEFLGYIKAPQGGIEGSVCCRN